MALRLEGPAFPPGIQLNHWGISCIPIKGFITLKISRQKGSMSSADGCPVFQYCSKVPSYAKSEAYCSCHPDTVFHESRHATLPGMNQSPPAARRHVFFLG